MTGLVKGGIIMAMLLQSPAFSHQGEMPSRYTCEGNDVSPPLIWKNVPAGTKSLALIVDDPDAPDPAAPKMTWVHWVLFNLPPDADSLAENVQVLPPSAREGMTDFGKTGYGGPCPPIGVHRYFFKLYALDAVLNLPGRPSKKEVLKAMQGHILEEAVLIGTYKKKK